MLNQEQDTFYDEATNTLKNEGQADISEFLTQLKQRKEEAKRKREQELKDSQEEENNTKKASS